MFMLKYKKIASCIGQDRVIKITKNYYTFYKTEFQLLFPQLYNTALIQTKDTLHFSKFSPHIIHKVNTKKDNKLKA